MHSKNRQMDSRVGAGYDSRAYRFHEQLKEVGFF